MKLEDLDDTDGPDLAADDGLVQEAQEFLGDLELLIAEDRVQYAISTLEGIYETVSRRLRVSAAQRQAVENIDAGSQRRPRR